MISSDLFHVASCVAVGFVFDNALAYTVSHCCGCLERFRLALKVCINICSYTAYALCLLIKASLAESTATRGIACVYSFAIILISFCIVNVLISKSFT